MRCRNPVGCGEHLLTFTRQVNCCDASSAAAAAARQMWNTSLEGRAEFEEWTTHKAGQLTRSSTQLTLDLQRRSLELTHSSSSSSVNSPTMIEVGH